MTAPDLIRRLHHHRRWATARLVEAAATLSDQQLRRPFEIGRGSLWATVTHLYAAERGWLAALRGDTDPPLLGPDAFDTMADLRAAWAELDAEWGDFLQALDDAALQRPITKSRSTGKWAGRVLTTPAVDVLIHVCTHAQYTAAQGVNMLRHLGVPAERLPDLQMIELSRGEAAGRTTSSQP